MTRSLLIIAALLCALAAPSAALAQGAGDEQYQDPFGDEQSEPTPTATPAPAQPAPSQAAPAPTATPGPSQAPAQAAPAQSGEQLPRTGADAGRLALAGALLLLSGLALRRRADLQR
jgi:2-oxoglutarate dehydrogenase E2 component (dihydrolipoamide succinyltransferase)